jgi:hypothetical protein
LKKNAEYFSKTATWPLAWISSVDIVGRSRLALGFDVKEIQPTPNPNAVKFLLDRPITERPTSFLKAESAAGHPLATRLFSITGVNSVLLLGDFVTINKSPEARWTDITAKVKQALSKAVE